MTKLLNFALKILGVVGRVAHAKSSDPATPQKKNWNVHFHQSKDIKLTHIKQYQVQRRPDRIETSASKLHSGWNTLKCMH